ncbi:MAG: hypothetical protein SFX72_16870 [Isosphaeraceae bacterium]|nr:hypothetical protein [Isosphaeraceae bacterium]
MTAPHIHHASGIGRFTYFLLSSVVGVVVFLTGQFLPPLACLIVGNFVMIFVSMGRLQNIGMNPAWGLLSIVPLANWVLGVRCQIFPKDYFQTRTLDTTARVILTVIFVVLAILLVMAGVAIVVNL